MSYGRLRSRDPFFKPNDTFPRLDRSPVTGGGRVRVPSYIATDAVGVAEALLVGLAAVLSHQLYSLLSVGIDLRSEPYYAVGLVGAILFHFALRRSNLTSLNAVLRGIAEWRPMLLSLSLSFLMLIGAAYALKVSANYS